MPENVTFDWILTSNGPGEISAQVKPIAEEIRKSFPQDRISLFIVPCQFASGHEFDMAKKITALDRIFTPKEYRDFIFNKKNYYEFNPAAKGVVIFLGGDPFHAILLKNKFQYPAYAYAEKQINWAGKFIEVFTPKTTGNLMADAIKADFPYTGREITDQNLTIGLYPGSRPGYLEYMVPYLTEVAEKLKLKVPHLKICWGIPQHLQNLVEQKFKDKIKDYSCEESCEGQNLDLIITLLGTNTAMQAIRGIPMLVLFPFHRPDLVPLVGILGLIGKIPIVGWLMKWVILRVAAFRIGYVAIPNIISKAEITPELKGFFQPDDVVNKAYELLQNAENRKLISRQLRTSLGEKGAAKKIINKIIEKVKK